MKPTETLVEINLRNVFDACNGLVATGVNVEVFTTGFSAGILALDTVDDLVVLRKAIDDFLAARPSLQAASSTLLDTPTDNNSNDDGISRSADE
jgi:hypothetical protein